LGINNCNKQKQTVAQRVFNITQSNAKLLQNRQQAIGLLFQVPNPIQEIKCDGNMNGKKEEYERESENEWQKLEGKIRRIAAILTKI